jgi:hypothetical protein
MNKNFFSLAMHHHLSDYIQSHEDYIKMLINMRFSPNNQILAGFLDMFVCNIPQRIMLCGKEWGRL